MAATPGMRLAQKVGAEAIGTFVLVLVGCGAIMVEAAAPGRVGALGVALAFGLAVAIMVYAVGHVSGAHFNPAVTVAFAATGRFRWREVGPYCLGQCVAACAAAAILRGLLGDVAHVGATLPAGGVGAALVAETVFTALLMFVISSVATDARAVSQMAGVAIGGAVAVGSLVSGPVSGASLNPARSLGPALVSGAWDAPWIYVVGPLLGALVGALAYRLIRCGGAEPASAGGCC